MDRDQAGCPARRVVSEELRERSRRRHFNKQASVDWARHNRCKAAAKMPLRLSRRLRSPHPPPPAPRILHRRRRDDRRGLHRHDRKPSRTKFSPRRSNRRLRRTTSPISNLKFLLHRAVGPYQFSISHGTAGVFGRVGHELEKRLVRQLVDFLGRRTTDGIRGPLGRSA